MLEDNGNRQLVEVEQTAMCLFKTVRTRMFVNQVHCPRCLLLYVIPDCSAVTDSTGPLQFVTSLFVCTSATSGCDTLALWTAGAKLQG